MPGFKRRHCRGDDRRRGREIGFAHLEVNDVAAGGFEFAGAPENPYRLEWRDAGHAIGEDKRIAAHSDVGHAVTTIGLNPARTVAVVRRKGMA